METRADRPQHSAACTGQEGDLLLALGTAAVRMTRRAKMVVSELASARVHEMRDSTRAGCNRQEGCGL